MNQIFFYEAGRSRGLPPTILFSLRKLSNTYNGNCLKIRRSSDNSEQDIGFVSNVLDSDAITAFVGSGTAYVIIWYDQSGNNRNLVQTTTTLQPTIYENGILNTLNGKPTLKLISQNMSTVSFPLTISGDKLTLFTIGAYNSNESLITSSTASGYYPFRRRASTFEIRFNGTTASYSLIIPLSIQRIMTLVRPDSANVQFYENNINRGIMAMSGTWGNRIFSIGNANSIGAIDCRIQEITSYPINFSQAQIAEKQSEMNSFYNIY